MLLPFLKHPYLISAFVGLEGGCRLHNSIEITNRFPCEKKEINENLKPICFLFPLLQVRWWQCRWQEFQGDQTLHLLSAEIQAPLPPGAGRISSEEMPAHAPESLAAGGQQRAGARWAAHPRTAKSYVRSNQVRPETWGLGRVRRAEHPATERLGSARRAQGRKTVTYKSLSVE